MGISILKATGPFCAAAVALALAASADTQAQIGDPATLIKEKLVSQIKLTKATADRSDIVTAGDVVVLHKDGLSMCSADSPYPASDSYENGVLHATLKNRANSAVKAGAKTAAQKLACRIHPDLYFCSDVPTVASAADNACKHREFVAGEKFRITDIQIAKDNSGIILSTFSDAYNNVRYYGEIEFPFPTRNAVPPVDEEVRIVSEVITVQPPDDKDTASSVAQSADPNTNAAAASATAAQPPPPAAPSEPMPELIPPPPPPADAPALEIALGETEDQVVAAFGQPANKATKLPHGKEIFFYKDRKITFLNGKVSDVE